MNDFHKQDWKQRYETMGSPAEQAFLQVHPYAHRLGLDKPNFSMTKLPAFFRQAPDFMLSDGVYEVMGVSSGADNPSLKMKHEKLDALLEWNKYGKVHLWVWDSATAVINCRTIKEWKSLMVDYATIGHFPDNNKKYWDLPIHRFM